MIRGLYSAASALDAQTQHQEVIAHNLAHANVAGHRRRGVAFETFDRALERAAPEGDILGTRVAAPFTAFQTGTIEFTGSPLDLAIDQPDTFFTVEGPSGPLYTRNGTFSVNARGDLVTKDGRVVLGAGGSRITIPANAARITVGQDGSVNADASSVGRIQLARFVDPSVLVPVGTTLFDAPQGGASQTGAGRVQQGYREASNVQVVHEMVTMIGGLRHYEASQRALRAISDAVQLNTRPQNA
jgi:flagellar basal body rod protein FlgG